MPWTLVETSAWAHHVPMSTLGSRSRRTTLALLSTAALLAAGWTTPATALQSTVSDGQDDPAGVDITSVTYDNQETAARWVVAVRDLGDRGRLVTRVGPPDSDVYYGVTVRVAKDGTLTQVMRYFTDTGSEAVGCDFFAEWSADEDTVTVEVPQRCLDFNRFLDTAWFQSTMYHGSASDPSKGVDVGRGDSPGCASKAEMHQVKDGDKKFRVHQMLDTAGKYDGGAAGTYGRTYTACDGGARYFIQYSGADDTVLNKGRVG